MTILTPESSALCWLSYDLDNHRLTVGFRDQTTYYYSGVPERVVALLLSSQSRGRYFNLEIRNRYPATVAVFRGLTGAFKFGSQANPLS
jgi:hypothetical protein